MKIHLVAAEWDGDQILARLARSLVMNTDWTVSTQPDSSADVNYFFPYLLWQGFDQTYTAGWFTHEDILHSRAKAALWAKAARGVNLRLTSAQIYQQPLLGYGTARYVTPPLDTHKFDLPDQKPRRQFPLVGTSGFVYPGTRKGADLALELLKDSRFHSVRWAAAGRGWPFDTVLYPWDELHRFYQGLDLYVCFSRVEGVGYGVLEALACGVPVVIPRGVGVMDEIEDSPGVYRYQVGDYSDLSRAVQDALGERLIYPERLRHLVKDFTLQRWVDDHLRAFEVVSEPPIEPVPVIQGERRAGVYYVAYGSAARTCAVTALKSWKQHMPDYPIALASTAPLGLETHFIPAPDQDIGARKVKLQAYDLTPQDWQAVLYLDADTELVNSVQFLFDVLEDGWELVICRNPDKYHTTRRMHRPDNLEEVNATLETLGYSDLIQWNGGVFGFRRCPRVKLFFNTWIEEWERWGGRDQAALLRALWRVPLRVYTLGNEWNTVTRYMRPEQTAGILHYPTTARRWSGRINGRLDSEAAWKAVKS